MPTNGLWCLVGITRAPKEELSRGEVLTTPFDSLAAAQREMEKLMRNRPEVSGSLPEAGTMSTNPVLVWVGGLLFCAAVWTAVFNLLGYAVLWMRYG
jgi:hypothetical protein